MNDASQGPGWWLASDGKWYPPPTAPPSPPPQFLTPPMPPPKRGHGCLWAVLATIGLAVAGLIAIVVSVVVAGHKIHKNFSTAGNLAGPPPAAHYRVGQTGASSGFTFTVYAVQVPFTSAGQYALPTAGYEYVQVDVQVTNTRSSTQQFSSLLAFHLYDAQDHQYGEAIVAGIQPGPPDGPFSPGQSVRGFAMFEVPSTAARLRLRCQGSLTAAGAVFQLT